MHKDLVETLFQEFNSLWKHKRGTYRENLRHGSYLWLAKKLGVPNKTLRFSNLTEDQLRTAILVCREAKLGLIEGPHYVNVVSDLKGLDIPSHAKKARTKKIGKTVARRQRCSRKKDSNY